MDGTITFRVDTAGWKYSSEKNVNASTSAWEMLTFLVPTTRGVDSVVGKQLRRLVDFSKVDAVMSEAPLAKSMSELGKTIAFLNARKLSQVINDVSALPGYQSKEKGEIAQFIRVYLVRKQLASANVFANFSGEFPSLSGKDEGTIQLISNNPQWKSVKKMTILDTMSPRTVMEFMGSYCATIDNRIEHYLGQTADLQKMSTFLDSAPSGKSAGELESVFQFLAGNELKKMSESISSAAKIPAMEKERMSKLLHVYAVRKVLENCKIPVNYSQIDIPGLKRLLKKKK